MRWAVLLAGGSGTRFWPLSTPENPKQLLPLSGSGPSAKESVDRLIGLIPRERILVVAGEGLADRLRERLGLPHDNVLVEPRAASTAPALIWATWEARRSDPDAEVLSLHADWAVGDAAAFRRTADAGARGRASSRPAGHRRRRAVAARDRLRLHRPRRPARRQRPHRRPILREARRGHRARPDGGGRAVEQRPVRLDRRPAARRGATRHTPEVAPHSPPLERGGRPRVLSGSDADLDRRRACWSEATRWRSSAARSPGTTSAPGRHSPGCGPRTPAGTWSWAGRRSTKPTTASSGPSGTPWC